VAWLIDGEAYFAQLAAAIERARHSVWLAGWDFHSRVVLRRDDRGEGEALRELVDRVALRKELDVRVLGWDFAMIYALEREALPLLRFNLGTGRGVKFRLDGSHPLGASHHQKLAVIDGAVAFSGGLDLTACRWDTPDHLTPDPRRTDAGFGAYPPFHDVQIAVDGDAARRLGAIFADRWQRATGERLEVVRGSGDAWPPELRAGLEEVPVGIARTFPAFQGVGEVREIEALYLRSIESAQRWIYIENQYLTAASFGDALCQRLASDDCPEILIVCPASCSGWLEEGTMGVLRAKLVARLREADRHDRLRILCPILADGSPLNVHSKVMIVDDRLMRIGSANLSNRSMGFDTECDLAIESAGEERIESAIRRFRAQLIGEHLGVAPPRFEEAMLESGSLHATVEALETNESRRLEPLEPLGTDSPEWLSEMAPAVSLADPERPVAFDELADRFAAHQEEEPASSALLRLGLGAIPLLALVLAWRFTGLAELTDPEALREVAGPMREEPLGWLMGLGLFVGAGLLAFPVTVMVPIAGFAFGWLGGACISLLGSLAIATLHYLLGRALWRDALRRILGRRLNALSRRLARRGVSAVAAVRMLPIAPFAVVNMAAGSSHVRLWDFVLGTALGMGPGIVILSLVGDRVFAALSAPSWTTLFAMGGAILAALGFVWWLARRTRRAAGNDLRTHRGDASGGDVSGGHASGGGS